MSLLQCIKWNEKVSGQGVIKGASLLQMQPVCAKIL